MDSKRTIWITLPGGDTVTLLEDAPPEAVGPIVGVIARLPFGGAVTVGVDVTPYEGGDAEQGRKPAAGHPTHGAGHPQRQTTRQPAGK